MGGSIQRHFCKGHNEHILVASSFWDVDGGINISPTGAVIIRFFLEISHPIARCHRALAIAIGTSGNAAMRNTINEWLNILQSVQLPFAIVPVLTFTAAPSVMGRFATKGAHLYWCWYATTTSTICTHDPKHLVPELQPALHARTHAPTHPRVHTSTNAHAHTGCSRQSSSSPTCTWSPTSIRHTIHAYALADHTLTSFCSR